MNPDPEPHISTPTYRIDLSLRDMILLRTLLHRSLECNHFEFQNSGITLNDLDNLKRMYHAIDQSTKELRIPN